MCTAFTVPASPAMCGTSVFITSRMKSVSPAATLSPGLTSTFQTLPGTIVSTFSAMFLPLLHDARRAADGIELLAQHLCFVNGDGLEAVDIARLGLPQLPEGSRWHGVRIDEPAHARPVIDQDDRRLPRKIDGAHRIALIDDVRRFGTVLGRLLGGLLGEGPLWTVETEAGAGILRREFPIGREEALVPGFVDPVVVWSRNHFDRPGLVGGDCGPAIGLHLLTRRALRLRHGNDLTF